MIDAAQGIVAHYSQYGWLLAVWSTPLVVLCLGGAAIIRPGPAGTATRVPRTPAFAIAFVALAAFVSIYAYAAISHEDLIGLDYAWLTGRPFVDMPIWPESGRFFPLAFQEYNLINLVGRSAASYHAFSILQLVVVLGCVFRILDSTPAWFRCLAMMFLIVLPGFVQSYFGLVYPERDMLFWLAVWCAFLQSFFRDGSRWAFCGALVAAQFLLYYKETSFILVGGFSGMRILVGAWASAQLLRDGHYSRFVRAHALEVAHLVLCGVFLLVYAVAIVPHVQAAYVNVHAAGASIAALRQYAESDPLLDVFAIAFAWRVVSSLAKRRALDPLWDSLAAGAFAYALAFVKLGMVKDYYLAPADFVATLYLARVAYEALRVQRRVAIAAAALVAAWAFQRNVTDAAARALDRKQFVAANARLASFLATYPRLSDETLTLFFPQVGGFEIMEFSSYLAFRGLHAAVKTPHRFPDGICQPSQAFQCIYEPAPNAGELIVLLPGHEVSEREITDLRATATQIFQYRREPTALERALRALAPASRVTEEPSDAYVFAVGTRGVEP